MRGKMLLRRVFAGKAGPFFRSRRRVDGRVTATLLPRLGADRLSTMCFCNTKYKFPSGVDVIRHTVAGRLDIGGRIRIGASVLTTTHNLYKRSSNVTYVVKANSGSYCCSKGDVIAGMSPLKFVLKSRNDKTYLNGLLMNSVLGGRVAPRLGRGFLGRFSLAPTSVVSHICHGPFPGHFLTDLSPFLTRGLNRPYMHTLMLGDFGTFLGHGIVRCRSCRRRGMRFVNSMTFCCGRILTRTTGRVNVRLNTVVGDPVRKLVGCRG